jgi:tetratricopeptide (TPR) repeat protein
VNLENSGGGGDIYANLKDKANEFILKAKLWQIFYDEPNWFEQTKCFFEEALSYYGDVNIVFEYALFLQQYNQHKEATPLYEKALKIMRELAKKNPDAYLPDVAHALNSLGLLQSANSNLYKAFGEFEKALKIQRELAEKNPDVDSTLNSLAILYQCTNNLDEALSKYKEDLKSYMELAEKNPDVYLSYVADTLNNLGFLHQSINKLDEALESYRELAKKNPDAYLPYVAGALNNLAIFYLYEQPEKSIACTKEAKAILQPYKHIQYAALNV